MKIHRAPTSIRALHAALLTIALLTPLTASAAASWWNGDWQYRKSITIKMPAAGAGTTSSVILPIRLHAGNFDYFQDVQPNGADLRFVTNEGTPLNYQLELLDPMVGLLVAWVELPVKAGLAEQPIWMYYGNPRAAAPDRTDLYPPDEVLVLHFGDSQGLPKDATANHFDASASTVQLGAPGVIGNGARLDGHSVVRISARPGLALSEKGGFAFSAWVQLGAASPKAVLYSQEQEGRHLQIGLAGQKLYAEIANGHGVSRVESTRAIDVGGWHHFAVSIGTQIELYLDGSPVGSIAIDGLPAVSGDVLIGGLDDPTGAGGLNGQLDELQIFNAARSAWWAQVTALGQSPDTTLIAYGKDESKGSAGKLAAYFAMMGNLLRQVSLDGLLVITITALLGLASFQVFFSKAMLLGRVERQDARFLAGFSERLRRDVDAALAGESAAIDGTFEVSGLHSMYRAGLAGLGAATAAGGGGARSWSSTEAFEAIRAALDGALVEASDRLNSRLVFMTIAIAGAPFLGLLGTVVGVMITFASIAAAGDVNVNTIAPGVAAAMTATVVGLLVAIPSLFGYNWLATRIGRRTTAMEAFAPQFLSNLSLLALADRLRPTSYVNKTSEATVHVA